jgi:hypothetical protein
MKDGQVEFFISIAAAATGASLGFWNKVPALLMIGALSLAAVIWAFTTSTDPRHPDFAWAAEGGDPQLVIAARVAFFYLPIFAVAAMFGLYAHYVRARLNKGHRQHGNDQE